MDKTSSSDKTNMAEEKALYEFWKSSIATIRSNSLDYDKYKLLLDISNKESHKIWKSLDSEWNALFFERFNCEYITTLNYVMDLWRKKIVKNGIPCTCKSEPITMDDNNASIIINTPHFTPGYAYKLIINRPTYRYVSRYGNQNSPIFTEKQFVFDSYFNSCDNETRAVVYIFKKLDDIFLENINYMNLLKRHINFGIFNMDNIKYQITIQHRQTCNIDLCSYFHRFDDDE